MPNALAMWVRIRYEVYHYEFRSYGTRGADLK